MRTALPCRSGTRSCWRLAATSPRTLALSIFGLDFCPVFMSVSVSICPSTCVSCTRTPTFAVSSSSGLDKALVETEVMPDAVTPGRRACVVAFRMPARQYLVDVSQNQPLLRRRQNRHRDERDVRLVRRFRAGGKAGRQTEVT